MDASAADVEQYRQAHAAREREWVARETEVFKERLTLSARESALRLVTELDELGTAKTPPTDQARAIAAATTTDPVAPSPGEQGLFAELERNEGAPVLSPLRSPAEVETHHDVILPLASPAAGYVSRTSGASAGASSSMAGASSSYIAKTEGRSDRHFLACLPRHAQHKRVRLTAAAGAGTIYRGMQS